MKKEEGGREGKGGETPLLAKEQSG